MPLRLPDQFHRPGVALVRVGDYVKIGLATKAKPVTVLVGNLRVPETLAVGPATFVGAFLTDRPDPSELTESVRREVERLTGEGPVAGDLYRLDTGELDTVLGIVENTGLELAAYGREVPYTTSSFEVDLPDDKRRAARTSPAPIHEVPTRATTDWLKPVPERRIDDFVGASEQKLNERVVKNSERRRAAAGTSGDDRSSHRERHGDRGQSRSGPAKSRKYTLSRMPVREREKCATREQYNHLVALGATVNVSEEEFTMRLNRREAVSAIDTQKGGVRHVTITS